MTTALNATLRYFAVLPTEPEVRLAAIVDFTFSLGAGRLQTSTLRRRGNQRDWAVAALALRRWVYGGGRVLRVIRRDAETALLLHNACLGHELSDGFNIGQRAHVIQIKNHREKLSILKVAAANLNMT